MWPFHACIQNHNPQSWKDVRIQNHRHSLRLGTHLQIANSQPRMPNNGTLRHSLDVIASWHEKLYSIKITPLKKTILSSIIITCTFRTSDNSSCKLTPVKACSGLTYQHSSRGLTEILKWGVFKRPLWSWGIPYEWIDIWYFSWEIGWVLLRLG